ncbi:hypothetical protein [Methylobacterium nodulans]|uniref:Uncharacterized protein n=1 Tax=Methylobacterium nodulans (strain LMG 21967 / CNCM I-2342 / ORS 2060) TaxID=460265 RepID=B8I9Y8_METNO|nr:hypothetical protein [Methylobacterium nodulans]ACL57216.1 conserved hypothetical protein [Methylobacterium nodulans ORS 2060]ACL62991.1 conserved hypothetical protein [Methylobacterium nodulans ORS 2060]
MRPWHRGLWQGGAVLLFSLGLAHPAPAAETFRQLTGPQIRARLTGKEVTDEVHWAYRFEPGGRLQTVSMGRARTGIWRLQGDALCLNADPCLQVWMAGTHVEFRRDGALPEEGVLQAPARRP